MGQVLGSCWAAWPNSTLAQEQTFMTSFPNTRGPKENPNRAKEFMIELVVTVHNLDSIGNCTHIPMNKRGQ